MPRPSNTTIRRQEIIEGLMTVMSTSGYSGASIPLIAEAAGLSNGLVHYHFNSKQAILLELIGYLAQKVEERYLRFDATTPKQRLDAYIDAHLSLGAGANFKAVSCWVGIGAEAVSQPEVRAAYQEVTRRRLETLEEICKQVLQDEHKSTRKKREIALGVMSAIEGIYKLTIAAPDAIPTGFASPTVKAMANGLITIQGVASSYRRT